MVEITARIIHRSIHFRSQRTDNSGGASSGGCARVLSSSAERDAIEQHSNMPPRQFSKPVPLREARPRRRRLFAALIAVPGLMPALAHAQLAGAAADTQPLGDAWSLRLAPQLLERPL
ncbi:MAG TPA: hypothetical protein VKJ77_22195, partial [Caballeronia sp.]|nr:hypothetical protein [Caballeronia sp.]